MSGGEIALLNLINSLDKGQYQPIVVLCSEGPFADNLRANGIETHVLSLDEIVLHTRKNSIGVSSVLQLKKLASLLTYTGRLANLFRQLRADLVHTNSLKADIIGAVSGRLAHIPVIWHVRDRIADDYLPSSVAASFRWLSTFLPTHVITISQAARQTLPADKNHSDELGRFSVVHDGVSPDAFGVSDSRNWNSQDKVRIGIVGRISPWKGQHVFVKAAALVRRQFPNAEFQIIGGALFNEHAYEAELHSLVDKEKLADTVHFLGFRSDVLEVMQGLDIIVHASTIGEPFGQVIVEGMAASKPVIATNGGAVPEIIQNGTTGILVNAENEQALADALVSLLNDPEHARAIGLAGRERARSNFSIEKTARNVERIYERFLS